MRAAAEKIVWLFVENTFRTHANVDSDRDSEPSASYNSLQLSFLSFAFVSKPMTFIVFATVGGRGVSSERTRTNPRVRFPGRRLEFE